MKEKPKGLREWSDFYFNQMYSYARKYSDSYGSLEVNDGFVTNDGVNYCEDGRIKLGRWIRKQLETVKPDSPRGELLTKIGMVWDSNYNRFLIHDLCRKYTIDIEVNLLLLNRLSAQEFKSKINYCIHNNIPIMNNCRELHEIFYLTNEELKKKYNITKEEMFDIYYNASEEKTLKRYY